MLKSHKFHLASQKNCIFLLIDTLLIQIENGLIISDKSHIK